MGEVLVLDFSQLWGMTKRSPLVWAFLISTLLHLIFYTSQAGYLRVPHPKPAISPPIELTMPPPSRPNSRLAEKKKVLPPLENQVVETEKAGKQEDNPEAKMLSNRSQKVEQETKAARNAKFEEKKGTGDSAAINPNWESLSMKELGLGGGATAATDDHLSNVAEGAGTVLNTREFQYFSYYQRIKDLLRQYWRPTVEKKLYKIWNHGKNVSEPELVTRIQVTLDEGGTIQRVARVASSGFGEIDDAAEEAFRQAAPFPNPPKGMVDGDGFVRINWDFILRMEAAPSIQFRNVGNVPY